jgi:hypothetical protein
MKKMRRMMATIMRVGDATTAPHPLGPTALLPCALWTKPSSSPSVDPVCVSGGITRLNPVAPLPLPQATATTRITTTITTTIITSTRLRAGGPPPTAPQRTAQAVCGSPWSATTTT